MLNMFDAWHSTRSRMVAVAALSAVLLVSACGSNNGSGPAGAKASGTQSSAAGPVGVEIHPPGDIPDNQAFVPYSAVGFVVSTPEGWAQSKAGSSVVFTDKYNRITISTSRSAQPPTTTSAQTVDVPAIKTASKGFALGTISTVKRTAGSAVLITYRAYSPVNAVTGKFALEAVERYTFWKAGTSVTFALAASVGSDNVDPWRTVTDSFAWTK